MILFSAVVATQFGIASAVMYFLAVIAVIALAYLTTIAVAKFYNKGLRSANIKIVERVNLATDKSLWLVSLGEKYYFLYTDRNGIVKLDELDDAIQLDLTAGSKQEKTFKELFNNKFKRSSDEQK